MIDVNVFPRVDPRPQARISIQTTCCVCAVGINEQKEALDEQVANKDSQISFFFNTTQHAVDLVNAMQQALRDGDHARLCINCKELFVPEGDTQEFCVNCLAEMADVSGLAEHHL